MLVDVEKYLRRSGVSATRFGREVARDPRLVHDMRNGREIGRRLRTAIAAYIGPAK